MKDKTITDTQITASSYYVDDYGKQDDHYYPYLARLYQKGFNWMTAEDNPSNPWIQVDFLINRVIYGIQTQGGHPPHHKQWTTMLQVQYGDSVDSLVFIKDSAGMIKVRNDYNIVLFVLAMFLFQPSLVCVLGAGRVCNMFIRDHRNPK